MWRPCAADGRTVFTRLLSRGTHMLRRTFALALLASTLFSLSIRADEKPFRAGAFAQDITPSKFPVSVNGGMSDVQARGAHDRLHARCLVLDDGTTTVAIVV